MKKTVDFEIRFVYGKAVFNKNRRCSSVVEHVIGNDGVASPILASGTIKKRPEGRFLMVSGKDGLAKQVRNRSTGVVGARSLAKPTRRARRVKRARIRSQRHH